MNHIISKIYTIIRQSGNLIEVEKNIRTLMYDTFSSILEDILTNMNNTIVKEKLTEGWSVEKNEKILFLEDKKV